MPRKKNNPLTEAYIMSLKVAELKKLKSKYQLQAKGALRKAGLQDILLRHLKLGKYAVVPENKFQRLMLSSPSISPETEIPRVVSATKSDIAKPVKDSRMIIASETAVARSEKDVSESTFSTETNGTVEHTFGADSEDNSNSVGKDHLLKGPVVTKTSTVEREGEPRGEKWDQACLGHQTLSQVIRSTIKAQGTHQCLENDKAVSVKKKNKMSSEEIVEKTYPVPEMVKKRTAVAGRQLSPSRDHNGNDVMSKKTSISQDDSTFRENNKKDATDPQELSQLLEPSSINKGKSTGNLEPVELCQNEKSTFDNDSSSINTPIEFQKNILPSKSSTEQELGVRKTPKQSERLQNMSGTCEEPTSAADQDGNYPEDVAIAQERNFGTEVESQLDKLKRTSDVAGIAVEKSTEKKQKLNDRSVNQVSSSDYERVQKDEHRKKTSTPRENVIDELVDSSLEKKRRNQSSETENGDDNTASKDDGDICKESKDKLEEHSRDTLYSKSPRKESSRERQEERKKSDIMTLEEKLRKRRERFGVVESSENSEDEHRHERSKRDDSRRRDHSENREESYDQEELEDTRHRKGTNSQNRGSSFHNESHSREDNHKKDEDSKYYKSNHSEDRKRHDSQNSREDLNSVSEHRVDSSRRRDVTSRRDDRGDDATRRRSRSRDERRRGSLERKRARYDERSRRADSRASRKRSRRPDSVDARRAISQSRGDSMDGGRTRLEERRRSESQEGRVTGYRHSRDAGRRAVVDDNIRRSRSRDRRISSPERRVASPRDRRRDYYRETREPRDFGRRERAYQRRNSYDRRYTHRSRSPPRRRTRGIHEGPKLFIGNIAYETDERILKRVFSKYGDVRDVYIPQRVSYSRSRRLSRREQGYGFVTFYNTEDAVDALRDLNHAELDGNVISVEYSKPRRSEPARYRSRSRDYRYRR